MPIPPDPSEIDQLLQNTLDDFRLSRSERKSLAQSFTTLGDHPQARSLWRSRAFHLARSSPNDPLILDWLEELLRLLDSLSTPNAPSPSASSSIARFSPGDACWREIVHRLDQTRRSADICVFTITDNRITQAIIQAHHRRVSVRILTDNDKSADLGSDIDELSHHGIEIRTDRRPAHMHHKFALLDHRYLLNGSYNWTRSASSENSENLITTTDSALISAFQAEFDRIWNALD